MLSVRDLSVGRILRGAMVLSGVVGFAGAAQARTPSALQPYSAPFVTNGPGWDGAGTNAATIGYNFNSSTADLALATQQAEILRAMNLWSKYANVTWTPKAANQTQSIDIGFVTGNHGDGSSFDGAGGVLAHAFYPAPNPNPETIGGDLHFDDAEMWTTSATSGTNLYTVAIHELGHSIGLNHSADTKSIMYAFYSGGAFGNALSTDDIAGIRSLYQAKVPTFSAEVSGTHTWRSDLTIKLGVKSSHAAATPLWETDIFLAAGGDLDDFDFSEIDLTEALAFANGTNDWYVSIVDSFTSADTGTLDEYSIRFGTTTLNSGDLGALGAAGKVAWIDNVLVPEPASLALLALPALLLGRRRR